MTIIIDPQIAGISGDMLLSALVDLGANKSKIIDGAHISESYFPNTTINKINFEKIKKNGIEATKLILDLDETMHERKGIEIKNCIKQTLEKIGLSEAGKVFAIKSIDKLINSESKIHGSAFDSVHFHEASSIDTIIDIIGSAIALDDLKYFDDEIITTPVAVGGGTVTFSHGTTSNPAAAILEIFKDSGIIISGGRVREELTTPTGASLLTCLASSCSEFYPPMKVNSIGYGAGKKDFSEFSNVLKIIKGQKNTKFEFDSVKILETNVDDVTGEMLGIMIEKIMEKGAKDVTICSAVTKKGRPTNLITVICDSHTMDSILDVLVSETHTLGVRVSASQRFILSRSIRTMQISIAGKNFTIHYKTSQTSGTLKNFKVESDDVKLIANSINKSFMQTEELIKDVVKKKLH